MTSIPSDHASPIEMHTLLGPGTHFEGKLTFEGCVRIDGFFKGEIQSDGILILGEEAKVHAEVQVGTAIVRGGELIGTVRAKSAIEMFAPAQVRGDIFAPSISIERGVNFQGQCHMNSSTEELTPVNESLSNPSYD